MAVIGEQAAADIGTSQSSFGWAWALKRTLLGVAILAVTMGGMAWLTYASIDPALDAAELPVSDIAASPH